MLVGKVGSFQVYADRRQRTPFHTQGYYTTQYFYEARLKSRFLASFFTILYWDFCLLVKQCSNLHWLSSLPAKVVSIGYSLLTILLQTLAIKPPTTLILWHHRSITNVIEPRWQLPNPFQWALLSQNLQQKRGQKQTIY